MSESPWWRFMMAGGAAGTAVDVILFPLDTLKTRLQSPVGFAKAGGFRGIYSGVGPAALGSAPTAATFFCSYEAVKAMGSKTWGQNNPFVHMGAAAVGECAACIIRVPVEIIKQRRQALHHTSSLHLLKSVLKSEGIWGLYRGYLTTVLREIPFSFIQFPLWEATKAAWSRNQGSPLYPWQSAICGALSGGIAAGLTTPLDVAKTRIMLADKTNQDARGHLLPVLRQIYTQGWRGLFAGVLPRVLWISGGGAIFLGVYDKVQVLLKT